MSTYQTTRLRITLKLPPNPDIFRVVLFQGDMNFFELHCMIQLAMGWKNSHSHEFEILGLKGYVIGNLIGMDVGDNLEVIDSRDIKLSEYLVPGLRIKYIYDMGDYWKHELIVEQVSEEDKLYKTPKCVEGSGCCPPEDIGGPHGYNELLKTRKYIEVFNRSGKTQHFNPDYFHLSVATARLCNLRMFVKKWGETTFPSI